MSHSHFTLFVKTCKVSTDDDESNSSANKETKQSCEFHFLWFMKAATAKQKEKIKQVYFWMHKKTTTNTNRIT